MENKKMIDFLVDSEVELTFRLQNPSGLESDKILFRKQLEDAVKRNPEIQTKFEEWKNKSGRIYDWTFTSLMNYIKSEIKDGGNVDKVISPYYIIRRKKDGYVYSRTSGGGFEWISFPTGNSFFWSKNEAEDKLSSQLNGNKNAYFIKKYEFEFGGITQSNTPDYLRMFLGK